MIGRVGTALVLLTASVGIAWSAELTVPMKTQHYLTNARPGATPEQGDAIKSATAQQPLKRKDGGT